jgi:uncharacterized protein
LVPEQLKAAVREHRYPLLFATISGAHLYGFPSPDSDWDLRGVHILPAEKVLGLLSLEQTVEFSQDDQIELDLVTHDVLKFFKMLLRPNGYVLEQLLSPLVVHTTPEHEELKQLVPGCLTRNHVHHYLGFAQNQWDLFRKEAEPRLKPLLYTFRVLLTGIHLMRSGEIEANLGTLNKIYGLPFIPELMVRKREGDEHQTLEAGNQDYYGREFCALRTRLIEEAAVTSLPASPTVQSALNDMLVRVRLASVHRVEGKATDS